MHLNRSFYDLKNLTLKEVFASFGILCKMARI